MPKPRNRIGLEKRACTSLANFRVSHQKLADQRWPQNVVTALASVGYGFTSLLPTNESRCIE